MGTYKTIILQKIIRLFPNFKEYVNLSGYGELYGTVNRNLMYVE